MHFKTRSNSLRRLLTRGYSIAQGPIRENDVLFLRQRGAKFPKWHLTKPLRPEARVKLAYGASLQGSDLIGRNILDVVQDSRGNKVVLHLPSLASYLVHSDRIATPIYPHDASVIVNLLDIDLYRPGEEADENGDLPQQQVEDELFEIFEAGTGHGSLTLHLARALHAANPPVPAALRRALATSYFENPSDTFKAHAGLDSDIVNLLNAYRARRHAVIHTLDRNEKHLRSAYKVIRDFRRSHYLLDIDFHIGSIEEYITSRLEEREGKPFLSRVVLDLPSPQEQIEKLAQALHHNGLLVVFCPSISQVAEFQARIMKMKHILRQEVVIELATSTVGDSPQSIGGGREWDVKTVFPRVAQDQPQPDAVKVMRPKVGLRVAGGGFVALYRRWPAASADPSDDEAGDASKIAEIQEPQVGENLLPRDNDRI